MEPTNLLQVLDGRAAEHRDRPLFRFLSSDGSETTVLTYAETARRARAIAGRIQSEGPAHGRALLLFPPGPDFVCAFLGCLAAGVTAVPVYPPDPLRLDRTLPRMRSIVGNARTQVVLADSGLSGLREPITRENPELGGAPWIEASEIDPADEALWTRPHLDGDSIALLQYTSGSTSAPKGVMVTHGNLVANLGQQVAWLGIGEQTRSVFWLPFYHDMGLIAGILLTMYSGGETCFLSPMDFVRRPLAWLEAISHYRAGFAGGPDFGYALCARRTTPEQRRALDLSCWKIAFSGAEPVRGATLDAFASAFECAGFDRRAFAPCYGLAEATLLVSGAPVASHPIVTAFDAEALEAGFAIGAGPQSVRRTTLVSCGPPAAGVDVRIVDPESGRALEEGQVGEVWTRGSNVTAGYWNAPEATASCFGWELAEGNAGFLRTGDLGFLHDGELYLTSRRKDLIIIRGRNHSPADIEHTVERAHPGFRAGSSAAFSIDARDGERLVVVVEAREAGDPALHAAVFEAAASAVFEQHGIAIGELVLISPRTIPKTSSGKIQRHAARIAYAEGTLETLASLAQAGGGARPL